MPLKARNMIDEDDPRVSQIGHPAPPWLVNYADLMTELVCFFVILYALSAALSKNVQAAKKAVEEVMKESKVAGEVKMTKDGMYITFQEQGSNVFFESGKADLTPAMNALMKKVAPTLKTLANKHEIVVEGHTDNVPVKTFASNWELSTARSTNVVRLLTREYGLNPRAVSAVGYGEFRPVGPNDTPENRSKNRRVVFFVKNNAPPGATAKETSGADAALEEAPETVAADAGDVVPEPARTESERLDE